MDVTPGMVRYRELVALWMAARERAGGKLTQAMEARWAGDVDRIWRTLTEDEQDALDQMSRPAPSSPSRSATRSRPLRLRTGRQTLKLDRRAEESAHALDLRPHPITHLRR